MPQPSSQAIRSQKACAKVVVAPIHRAAAWTPSRKPTFRHRRFPETGGHKKGRGLTAPAPLCLLVRALAPLLLRRRFGTTLSLVYAHSFVSPEPGVDEKADA